MKITRKVVTLVLISVFALSLLYLHSLARKNESILNVSDGELISFENMIKDLKRARLVFIGEFHDNKDHHDTQLKIIKELEKSGASVVVGLEMFRSNSQDSLDKWVSGEMNDKSFKKVFSSNWGGLWPLYKGIFFYARDAKIPLLGLNVPREIPKQVARSGFASLSSKQLEKLPGVRCDIDPEYEKFIRRAMGAHGSHGISFTYFCEAQMVWDTTMAWNLLNYLGKNPDHTVVVLAGSGHSWKRGIPEQVRRKSEVPFRVVLPEIPERMDRHSVTFEDADYLWFDT